MEQFYIGLDDEDIKRINFLLRAKWELVRAENVFQDLSDHSLCPQKKEEIKRILRKEPTEKLLTLLTFYAQKIIRFMEFRAPLTPPNARMYFDEVAEALDKVISLIRPFQLMKYSLYTEAAVSQDKYEYLERNAAIAKTILEDVHKTILLTTNALPKAQKGNRSKKAETVMQAIYTAKIYSEVEQIYESDELMKREKKALILNVTAELLRFVGVRPAGVNLNTKDARDRFNATLKLGLESMGSKEFIDSEDVFLYFM